MKHVNLTPDLELKKAEIMKQFDEENDRDSIDRPPVQDNNGSTQDSAIEDGVPLSTEALKERVIDALKTVYDPEIPVNIYDLGLIYKVDISGTFVDIDMTLTAPGCPVAHSFPGMVERSVMLIPGVDGAAVELVWDPPWTPDLISEAARLELGMI